MKGTIDVSKHFDAWSNAGLDMSGTLYEVSLNIEGYRSNGSANVKSVNVTSEQPDPTTTSSGGQTITTPSESDGKYWTSDFESGAGDWTGRGQASVATDSADFYDGGNSLYVSGRGDNWHSAGHVFRASCPQRSRGRKSPVLGI